MRYSIGSISKQFTAAAILLLQEEGKLSLDDAVGKYVPDLTRGDEVTIRQILSHTSGYQDYWPEDYLMTTMTARRDGSADHRHVGEKSRWTLSRERNRSIRTPTSSSRGASWSRLPARRYMEFLDARIFRPLGMQSVWNSDEAKLTEADATPSIAMLWDRCAYRPRRVAAGCSRQVSWP